VIALYLKSESETTRPVFFIFVDGTEKTGRGVLTSRFCPLVKQGGKSKQGVKNMSKTKKWVAAGLSVAMCACGAVGLKTVLASAEETAPATTPTVESLYLGDIPEKTAENSYGFAEGTNVNYKMMVGWFNADAADYGLKAFDSWTPNEQNQMVLSLTSVPGLLAQNWQWVFAANSSVVIVMESKIDGKIKVDMSNANNDAKADPTKPFGGWYDAYHSLYTVHRYNAEAETLDTLVNSVRAKDSVSGKTYSAEEVKTPSTYDIEIEVKAGDVVYYEIGTHDGRNLQNLTYGRIVATPAAAEVNLQEQYGAELDTLVSKLTREHYTDSTWANIETIVNNFKNDTFETDEEITAAFNQAKADIQAVAPDSVAYFVSDYGKKLDTLVKMLHSEDYLANTWTEINGLVTTFKNGTYTSEAEVKTAYDTAVTEIRAKETDAEKVSQTYTFGDLPKQTGDSGFDYYERNNVRYKLMAGLFNESADGYGLKPFDTWNGAQLTLSSVPGLSAENWRWMFAPTSSVVLVMQAKTEGVIEFKMSDSANLLVSIDAYDVVFSVHRYNDSAQTLDTLVNYVHGTDTVSGKVCTDEDFKKHPETYDCKVLVKENDVVYYEIGSSCTEKDWIRNIQNQQSAHIVATPLTSANAKEVYGGMLEEYVAGLTQANYTDETWAKIQGFVTAFTGETYDSVEATVEAYDDAKDKIDAVKPDSFTYFGGQLDALVATLEEADYETETWNAINGYVSMFKSGNPYASSEAMKTAYETAKNSIETTKPDSLTFVRAELLQNIEAYRNSLKQENFDAEDWATILEAYNTYKSEQADKADKAALKAFYDEQLAAMKSVKAAKQEVVYLDYLKLMSQNGFGWIEGDVVDTKLFTGTVKDGLVEFDVYDEANNKMYNSGLIEEDPTCYVQNWRWFVGVGKGVIVAYRAKVDCAITVTDTRIADRPGSTNGWTDETVLNLYIVRGDIAKLVNTVRKPTTDKDFSGTYYAKAGDIIYIEFTTTTAVSARNTESPCDTKAVADAKGFNEDLYTEQNHDLPIEVQNLIAEKKTALEEYYAGLNESDYSATNWTMFEDYINQFAEKCGLGISAPEVKNADDVNALYDEILAAMKAVLTKEQAAAELSAALEGYVGELQAEYDKLVAENKYSAENKEKLDKALEDGIAKIRAAKSKAAGNTAKSTALAAMRAIEKKGKGCKGSVAGTGIGLAVTFAVAGTVVAAAVVSRKKKND